MRWLACVLLVACSGTPAGTGTVVYSAGRDGIHLVDVATSDDHLLSSGLGGAVAITDDAEYIAFVRGERVVHVIDRAGTLTILPLPGKGCAPTPTWGPNHSLSWCVSDATGSYTAFLPTVGAAPRLLPTSWVIASADGARIAYLLRAQPGGPSPRGDLVVEDADGANRRTLRTDVNVIPIEFTTDDTAVLVNDFPTGVMPRIQRIALADGAVTDLGPGGLGRPIYSPDGTELLAGDGMTVFALDPLTGQRRTLVRADAGETIGGAGFLDRDRVVFVSHRDMSVGDLGMFRESIHVSDGTTRSLLVPEAGTNAYCRVHALSLARGFVVADCGGTVIAAFDGDELARFETPFEALGVSPDDSGVVVTGRDGTIGFLDTDGDVRDLVQTQSVFTDPTADTGLQPFAAYSPAN